MQVKGRKKIGYSQVNNPIILRISYVYVTYILRIWYVIDSGKTRDLITLFTFPLITLIGTDLFC